MARPKRPNVQGMADVTTPFTATMMQFIGVGGTFENVAFSKTEIRNLKKLYGFEAEKPNKKPPPPEPPKREDFGSDWDFERAGRDHKEALKRHANWQDPRVLMQAGADRNLFRHVRGDGLRLAAYIAKFCEPGEDPLKVLIRMAIDAGDYAVDPEDVTWAEAEEDEPEAVVEEPPKRPRPPLKDAIVEVMGNTVMTAAQVLKAVEAKYGEIQLGVGGKDTHEDHETTPTKYISYLLSSRPKEFERVERGKYRVIGVRKAG